MALGPSRAPEAIRSGHDRAYAEIALASGALRDTVKRLQDGLPPVQGVQLASGTRIRVEILHGLGPIEIRNLVSGAGGIVEGEVAGVLVQAIVPYDRLVELEAHPAVQSIRPPLEANVPLGTTASQHQTHAEDVAPAGVTMTGQEVAKTNADDWHAAGFTGAGIKVGIIDLFDGTLWSNAQAAGEVPAPAGTFCQVAGSACDIWTILPGSQHGEAVGEIVHEMAPSAQLYIATVATTSDLQAAVTYFAGQGVDIISRSLTAQYDGPGDGTGPIATVIDDAVANGMTWFNSAGNSASDGSFFGQYWRGVFVDSDADQWHEFAPGSELMPFVCPFSNGVRWSDFGGAGVTDFDVYVFDNPGDLFPISSSVDDQGGGALPLEHNIACTGTVDYLAIRLFDAGSGAASDILEFMVNRGELLYWQNPYSGSGPASDTASTGGLAVGAIDPPLGTTIAPYSAQGPTNDFRTKPDLSAAACVDSFTYWPGCFDGTSSATPAAAGAAALVLDAGLATTPAQLKSYLLNSATTDRGATGADNVYGQGELVLPAPPTSTADADGDGVPDTSDNCPEWPNPGQELPPWSTPASDSDCDGYSATNFVVQRAPEAFLGTDPADRCADTTATFDERGPAFGEPLSPWPPDINDDGKTTVSDALAYAPVWLAISGQDAAYDARYDLNGDGKITVPDVLSMAPFWLQSCDAVAP